MKLVLGLDQILVYLSSIRVVNAAVRQMGVVSRPDKLYFFAGNSNVNKNEMGVRHRLDSWSVLLLL